MLDMRRYSRDQGSSVYFPQAVLNGETPQQETGPHRILQIKQGGTGLTILKRTKEDRSNKAGQIKQNGKSLFLIERELLRVI